MKIIQLSQVTNKEFTDPGEGIINFLNPINPDTVLNEKTLTLVQITWNVVSVLFDVAVYGFLLALLIAGAQMLFSDGQEEKMGTAKKNITYAIVGLFIVFFGHLAINYIRSAVGDVSAVSISALVATIFEVVLAIAGAGFLLILLFSGVRYLTAGGSDETVGRAKSQIVNAIIGIAMIALAFAIGRIILLILGIVE